jgi:hypothetical protein
MHLVYFVEVGIFNIGRATSQLKTGHLGCNMVISKSRIAKPNFAKENVL